MFDPMLPGASDVGGGDTAWQCGHALCRRSSGLPVAAGHEDFLVVVPGAGLAAELDQGSPRCVVLADPSTADPAERR